jgi:hypothetical protein
MARRLEQLLAFLQRLVGAGRNAPDMSRAAIRLDISNVNHKRQIGLTHLADSRGKPRHLSWGVRCIADDAELEQSRLRSPRAKHRCSGQKREASVSQLPGPTWKTVRLHILFSSETGFVQFAVCSRSTD